MSPSRRRALIAIVTIAVLLAATAAWWLSRARTSENSRSKTEGAIPVVTAEVERRDVPVRLRANGSVIALQSVDLRAQITGTVRQVHITEGQFVRGGELLVSLDSRAQDANVQKAAAQVEKDRSDLATATRNLDRQRELFDQQFISRATLDVAQSKVDTLTGQLAVDQAALEAARVSRAYTEIRATFAGRTGAIGVRPGSVVQPNSAPLVTVIQIDPIDVAFTLPQKELAGLQRALAAGPVSVEVRLEGVADSIPGRISFVDNTVDTATGTIRVKAEFANPSARLWPGMFVNVALAPRMLENASVVPAQAVQTGPDSQFVYIVGADRKVVARPVTLAYVEEGRAVVDGIAAGARIVVEGAQNLRPGSVVSEAGSGGSDADQVAVKKGASKKNDRAASEPEKAP